MKFIRMAPVYDSGKCLFTEENSAVPLNAKGMLDMRISSFASAELKMLSYVTDRTLVDVTKLPPPEYIRTMHSRDSKIAPEKVDRIVKAYEIKLDLFRIFQLGRDIRKISLSIPETGAGVPEKNIRKPKR